MELTLFSFKIVSAGSISGEQPNKEIRVNLETISGLGSNQVKETILHTEKMHKKKNHGNRFLPKPFERSNGSLFNPRFDSEILEHYFIECYFTHARRLFQNTVVYVAVASASWALFFGLRQINYPTEHWRYFVGASIVLFVVMLGLMLLTFTPLFKKYSKLIGVFLAIVLVIFVQLPCVFEHSDISPVGTFFGVVEILILLYSFIPLNLNFAAGLGGILSISYEVCIALRFSQMRKVDYIICKLLLHLIIHFIGIFIFIMSHTRNRRSFSKIGQSVSAQQDLMVERDIQEKMIHSLMPPAVAKSVMAAHLSTDGVDGDDSVKNKRPTIKHVKEGIVFRNFQMDEMKDVSILYADIVGFTKMSSNKTAEHLVGLLNCLFGRFDKLCNASGCEKISTLGDCYYCVSGCPNPCADHAKCCVEMGLSMVIAIRAFDEDHNEEVNMRVGIHTGTVLCGIVGTVRFKFDVWSNDVTLANIMESTGEPGMVHISEATREFLVNDYEMIEGDEVPDIRGRKDLINHYEPAQSSFSMKHREETLNMKTFFITGRKPGNMGIPGLDALADQRHEHLLCNKKKTNKQILLNVTESCLQSCLEACKNLPNDVSTSSAAANLFSQRPPDIMSDTEATDNQDNGVDEPPDIMSDTEATDNQDNGVDESGVDSTLLKQNRGESTTEYKDRLLVLLIAKENENIKAFLKSNLNKLCLTFEPALETMYRNEYKDNVFKQDVLYSHVFQENLLSSPRYLAAVEAAIALVTLLILAICCHIMFRSACTMSLFTVTVLGVLLVAVAFLDTLTNIICLEAKKAWCSAIFNITLDWYFRNALGVTLATIPSLLVYLSLSCDLVVSDSWQDRFFCFCSVVALLQYCNFTMLRSFAKTITAILVSSVLIILLHVNSCSFSWSNSKASSVFNISLSSATGHLTHISSQILSGPISDNLFSGENTLRFEIIPSTLLFLLLICILNYEFENSYRLSFNASVIAQKDKENMQLHKEQADWLLHNIIPAHLAELFRTNRSYSRNHQYVGVMFAAITNFNEFYDEMYAGGRECLRVLNELVSDYEVMLSEPRFKDVEKIKTNSSTFMAAAGLNEELRAMNKHTCAHLYALMEFAMELQMVVSRFNENIFGFKFVLTTGYNYGPVTAGVIGTTKLLYDIWGDTVNIASRMYTTGKDNRIQVTQATSDLLSEMFEFSYRGEIPVKGKGVMKTCWLERKKPDANWG